MTITQRKGDPLSFDADESSSETKLKHFGTEAGVDKQGSVPQASVRG